MKWRISMVCVMLFFDHSISVTDSGIEGDFDSVKRQQTSLAGNCCQCPRGEPYYDDTGTVLEGGKATRMHRVRYKIRNMVGKRTEVDGGQSFTTSTARIAFCLLLPCITILSWMMKIARHRVCQKRENETKRIHKSPQGRSHRKDPDEEIRKIPNTSSAETDNVGKPVVPLPRITCEDGQKHISANFNEQLRNEESHHTMFYKLIHKLQDDDDWMIFVRDILKIPDRDVTFVMSTVGEVTSAEKEILLSEWSKQQGLSPVEAVNTLMALLEEFQDEETDLAEMSLDHILDGIPSDKWMDFCYFSLELECEVADKLLAKIRRPNDERKLQMLRIWAIEQGPIGAQRKMQRYLSAFCSELREKH